MILPQQILQSVASRRLVPEFVQRKYDAFSSTTFTVTLDTPPVEGNFLVLMTGGSQNRSPSFPGFTGVDMSDGSQSNWVAYKFAGAGESDTITVTWNLSLQGSLVVYEFTNVDTLSPLIAGTGASGVSFTAQTSVQYSTFAVPNSAVYLLSLALSNGAAWTIDSGYITPTTSSRFYPAYKTYASNDDSEAPTWAGTSISGNYAYIGFNGKQT